MGDSLNQVAISDQIIADLNSKAAAQKCTLDDLLRSMLDRLEAEELLVQRLATPELGARIARELREADPSTFISNEEVDKKFADFFEEIRNR